LDRLEKRRFIKRVRDPHDRRKVLIQVQPNSLKPLIPKYEAVGQAYLALVEQYDDKQLALICDYLEKTSELSERQLAKAIAANRRGATKRNRTPRA
ncbi:MAG TPA: hypothetical protein VKB78_09825, partial [Pirellulales bacterium]|nr:hypothetical protein [Pirellulales bacterium]